MSCILEYVACPQCGGVLNRTVDAVSEETVESCFRCGYRHKKRPLPSDGESPSESGFAEETKIGYGVIGAAGRNGITQIYFLNEPYGEKTQNRFEELLKQDGISAERCFMTRWDEEQRKVIAVQGPLPESYEEFIGEPKDGV